jgi:anti-sigma regulatory factor (Ser/Thr protein kinase)
VAEPIDTGAVETAPIEPGADVDEATGGGSPVAVATRTRDWRFPSTAMSVRTMRRELRPFLASSELPEQDVDDLVLAACEAAANGIEHARHPAEPFFDVQAEIDGRNVRIVVRDYGRWTPPNADPGNRGRGLHMMTMLAAVSLTSGPLGTSVTLRNLVGGHVGR